MAFTFASPELAAQSAANDAAFAGSGTASTSAATTPVGGTDVLGAAISKLLADPQTAQTAAGAVGGIATVIENAFGIQTPQQKAAAAQAAAAQAAQQQTTMLIVGGVIVAIIVVVVTVVVVRKK